MKMPTKRVRRIGLLTAAAAGGALFLTAGTGCDAATEEWNDAKVVHKYDHGAEVYSMPDGFANIASKCDVHGNRMYSEKIDSGRAVAVVKDDPSCDQWRK